MEYHPSLANGIAGRLNAQIFWKIGLLFADGIIPISSYLQKRVLSIKRKVPVYKIPVLADFNHEGFNNIIENSNKYFLYCGSIGYNEVIELIINAFNKLPSNEVDLYLILHGNKRKIDLLKQGLNNYRIHIFHEVSQYDLYQFYTNSIGLLIPLRPIIRDIARFPQKIAEYLASGSPLITNNVGEIEGYLHDRVNVILAEGYSINAYCSTMQFVLDNLILSSEIGRKGKELGYRHFHYESISEPFSKYLQSI